MRFGLCTRRKTADSKHEAAYWSNAGDFTVFDDDVGICLLQQTYILAACTESSGRTVVTVCECIRKRSVTEYAAYISVHAVVFRRNFSLIEERRDAPVLHL